MRNQGNWLGKEKKTKGGKERVVENKGGRQDSNRESEEEREKKGERARKGNREGWRGLERVGEATLVGKRRCWWGELEGGGWLNIEQKGKSGRVNGTVKRLVNTSTYRVRRRHAGMQACRHAATRHRHANNRDTQHAWWHARAHTHTHTRAFLSLSLSLSLSVSVPVAEKG